METQIIRSRKSKHLHDRGGDPEAKMMMPTRKKRKTTTILSFLEEGHILIWTKRRKKEKESQEISKVMRIARIHFSVLIALLLSLHHLSSKHTSKRSMFSNSWKDSYFSISPCQE